LHRQFRAVVESDWYRELFPNTQWAKSTNLDFVTTKGGGRYAVSVGGTLTGRGADLIIVDDPLNASEAFSEPARRKVIDWYVGALVSRLNNKGKGAIVVVAQRLHEDDLPGHLLRAGGFEDLCLPAVAVERQEIPLPGGRAFVREPGDILHPEREGRDVLERIKAEMGSLAFSAAYQQRPLPLEGNLCRREWIQFYERLPELSLGDKIVQSWDIATSLGVKNDWSVCTTWLIQSNDYYLVSVFRARLEYPALRRKVIELAGQCHANAVLIEEAGPGANLLQDLHVATPNGMTRPIGVKPEGSKAERFGAQTAKIEAGHVHLPKDAAWLADFLDELLGFPASRHDDQVDSVSQFLSWAHGDAQWSKALWAEPIVVYSSRPTMFDHPGY
jgi:predicted phage terminase large subunit-like protein